MIKLPPGIEIDEIPLEKRYASTLKGLLTRIRKLYEAVEDRFGDEGLKLIRDATSARNTVARSRRGSANAKARWIYNKWGFFS